MTPTARSYGGRTAEQRRLDRRARLLDAALELFGTDGYAAVPVERLCSTAAVSTKHFYAEFGSREQVLVALHEQINAETAEAVTQARAEAASLPLADRIRYLQRAYVASTCNDARRARVAYIEIVGVSADVEQRRGEQRTRWHELVDDIVTEAITNGEIEPGNYRLAIVALINAASGLVHDAYLTGQASQDDIATELVRLWLARLGAAAPNIEHPQ